MYFEPPQVCIVTHKISSSRATFAYGNQIYSVHILQRQCQRTA
ncbi:MAG: hypothetical protein QOE47_2067, partial [Pyrinomonadaceae bacterium]|nr:hypothetical protein [Pyrinomonadaceae bacterium]